MGLRQVKKNIKNNSKNELELQKVINYCEEIINKLDFIEFKEPITIDEIIIDETEEHITLKEFVESLKNAITNKKDQKLINILIKNIYDRTEFIMNSKTTKLKFT